MRTYFVMGIDTEGRFHVFSNGISAEKAIELKDALEKCLPENYYNILCQKADEVYNAESNTNTFACNLMASYYNV